MSAELKSFVQRVLRVASPVADVGGAMLPPFSGVNNAGGDTVQRLHVAVIEFARSHHDPHPDPALVAERARVVEGLLMACVTLGAMPDHEAVRLLDDLQGLLEKHHIPQPD